MTTTKDKNKIIEQIMKITGKDEAFDTLYEYSEEYLEKLLIVLKTLKSAV